MVVRPADDLVGERRVGRKRGMIAAGRSKTTSYAAPGEPDHDIVLRGGQDVAAGADHRLVEPVDAGRRRGRRDGRPQLGPEAGDEVDAADRRPRLAQRGDQRRRPRPAFARRDRSNSRYACDAVPSAKIPVCGAATVTSVLRQARRSRDPARCRGQKGNGWRPSNVSRVEYARPVG